MNLPQSETRHRGTPSTSQPYGPTPSRGQARQEHVSTKSLGKETCYQAARTKPPPPHNAALSRRRSENKPPHDYNAIPAENNPLPPQIALLSGLYSCILYYYLYLFCFIVFYLTPVLIRFVKLCVCRDLYTTRARIHIASP